MAYQEEKMVFFDGRIVAPEPTNAEGGEPAPSPLGRLKCNKGKWIAAMKEMGPSAQCAFTLAILTTGYKLEWENGADAAPAVEDIFCREKNHPSTAEHAQFITDTIKEGLRMGTVIEVDESALVCVMALGVAIHSRTKKKRQIFDARHLNKFLKKEKFKMESLHVEGRTLFENCVSGGLIDVSTAYHHIDVDESHWKYLGFSWKGRFYAFTVLPFGISTAPRVFTKVMKTCTRYMREILGLRFINYIDDFPFAYPSDDEALVKGNQMAHTLSDFGWLVHPNKCVGLKEATPLFDCLGCGIDLRLQKFVLSQIRIQIALEEVRKALASQEIRASALARVKGLLASMWLAIGSHARIRTRSMDKVVASRLRPGEDPAARGPWQRKVQITPEARAELEWFNKFLEPIGKAGRPFREAAVTLEIDGTTATDASGTGFGGWIATHPEKGFSSQMIRNMCASSGEIISATDLWRSATEGVEIWGALPPSMVGTSSGLREIYGAYQLINMFQKLMKGGRFRLLMDNMSCVMALGGKVPYSATGGAEPKSVLGGSRVQEIQEWVIKLLDLAQKLDISILAQWIPRELNTRSDSLSRESSLDRFEYWIKPKYFHQLDKRWGTHSVDIFSVHANVRVNSGRFCSRFFDTRAEWTDAFSKKWSSKENIWAHPPPKFIGESISHLIRCGCAATLLVPMWKSASWWPILYPKGSKSGPAPFISSVLVVGVAAEVLEGSFAESSSEMGKSNMIAFRLRGSQGRVNQGASGQA